MWATRLTGLGLEFGICVVLGWWLDGRWKTTPWLTLAGIALGLTAATWHMVALVRPLMRRRPRG
jgi:F0F1-type ATP synthase assembly protein I